MSFTRLLRRLVHQRYGRVGVNLPRATRVPRNRTLGGWNDWHYTCRSRYQSTLVPIAEPHRPWQFLSRTNILTSRREVGRPLSGEVGLALDLLLPAAVRTGRGWWFQPRRGLRSSSRQLIQPACAVRLVSLRRGACRKCPDAAPFAGSPLRRGAWRPFLSRIPLTACVRSKLFAPTRRSRDDIVMPGCIAWSSSRKNFLHFSGASVGS
jgi:hypothetical protein